MEDNHVKKVSSIFRWLPRFNLKMLLIAFTIVGILLGFLGRHLYKARQQQMAVAKLTLAGATVRYESKFMRRFGPNILSDGTSETWSEGWDDWMAATFGKDAAYKVHSVYISAPGDEVKEIHKLPWLKELKVSADSASISLTDEAWSAVLQCVQIEKLSFKQAIHNPRGLAGLSKLSRLQHVVIDSGNMTIENSEEISQLKQLKHIDLILVGTSDEGLQPFAKLSALESLNLTHRGKSDSVTDRGVAFVSQLPALRSLTLARLPLVTDKVFLSIEPLIQLESLNLDQSSVRGTEIHRLKNQTKLTHLNLIGTNVDDKALEHIGSFSQLEWLDLSFTKVTDAGMKDLSQLQHLQELYLG